MNQAMVHTFHAREARLPSGWARDVRLTVSDGIIVAVARDTGRQPGDEAIAVAMPGMPNLHSHAFQRGMAGLAERRGPVGDSFWTWREIMYRFVERLSPDDLAAIAALAYMEMLESGFTRVGEFHYLHHDSAGRPYADRAAMSAAIVSAAAETGIGLTHLPVFYAHSGFGGAAPTEGQCRFLHDLDGFAATLDAIRATLRPLPDPVLGVAPHSLRAVTPDELAALATLAGEGPIHIHIAEQVKEVEDCLAWSGRRPVEWLLGHAPVDRRWCLVHATHMTPAETEALARSGAIAGLCPITEANLGDGIFPASAYVRLGGRYGIGSDSNVRIDMTEELRLLEYGQRLAWRERNILSSSPGDATGDGIAMAACAGGAAALGCASGLEVGCAADFIGLDPDHPALVARDGAARIDALVFAAGRSAIDGVWRRGVRQVAQGRHRKREEIVRRYARVLARMLG